MRCLHFLFAAVLFAACDGDPLSDRGLGGLAAGAAAAPSGWSGEPWAEERGVYTFVLGTYHAPWGNRDWTLDQWRSYVDFLAFLGLNHFQMMRAPWSERPAATAMEEEKERLWRDVFAHARSRGMRTSVILSSTFHGTPGNPWHILSPNSPDHPHWQTLLADYAYFAERYGETVDEWHFGVEDPGGCPRCSGSGWAGFTPTEECNPENPVCTQSDLFALMLEGRRLARQHNPDAEIVAQTWAAGHGSWWAPDPGHGDTVDNFLRLARDLPETVAIGTHGHELELTERLREGSGRVLVAWPFYLLDHEFSAGMTRMHFAWTNGYLRRLKESGFRSIVPHVTHPVFLAPMLYVYAGWLHDIDRDPRDLLEEFSAHLVGGNGDAAELAAAMYELGMFWDRLVGIANWDPSVFLPLEESLPHRSRYPEETIEHIDQAREAMRAVGQARPESGMPMVVTPGEWVGMLRDQIEITWNYAHFDQLLDAAAAADAAAGRIGAGGGTLTRAEAELFVEELGDGRFLAREALQEALEYQLMYWPNPTQWASPFGLIYESLAGITAGAVVFEEGALRIESGALVLDHPGGEPVSWQITE